MSTYNNCATLRKKRLKPWNRFMVNLPKRLWSRLENSAISEGGAILFLNMITEKKTAPTYKVVLFFKTAPRWSRFGSTFFSQCT